MWPPRKTHKLTSQFSLVRATLQPHLSIEFPLLMGLSHQHQLPGVQRAWHAGLCVCMDVGTCVLVCLCSQKRFPAAAGPEHKNVSGTKRSSWVHFLLISLWRGGWGSVSTDTGLVFWFNAEGHGQTAQGTLGRRVGTKIKFPTEKRCSRSLPVGLPVSDLVHEANPKQDVGFSSWLIFEM